LATRILIYDDNVDLRESLQTLFACEPAFEIVAVFDNAETVLIDIAECKPDVILMDIDMPGLNGVEAVKLIRTNHLFLPVIMLTVFEDNDNIFNSIYAGASGYILKRHATEITESIDTVLNGGAPMTGGVARKVLDMLASTKPTDNKPIGLSDREIEILKLLVEGYSFKMIAENKTISVNGVRFHMKKIYEKLHVHSATEAVSKAIRQKLV